MKLTQKRSRYKTGFDFGPETLEYTFSTRAGRRGYTVRYEDIPLEWKITQQKSWRIKYLCLLLALLGVELGLVVISERPGIPADAIILMAAGIGLASILFVLDRVFNPSVRFTIVPMKNEIRIISDSQHQAIVDEIVKGRLEALRRKFAQIDPLNLPANEARKFRWLCEEGAISSQEFDEAFAKLVGKAPGGTSASAEVQPNRLLH